MDKLERLDILVSKKFNFSRNYSEYLIKNKNIYINNIPSINKHKKYLSSVKIQIIMNENIPLIKYVASGNDRLLVITRI